MTDVAEKIKILQKDSLIKDEKLVKIGFKK